MHGLTADEPAPEMNLHWERAVTAKRTVLKLPGTNA
jgi:hypothetical protein